LLDLLGQKLVDLGGVTHFVLDEADRMLDMGFVHDVARIVGMIPRERQTLFFSATMAPAIEKLARTMLANPERVVISPAQTTAQTVDQSVIFVAAADKRSLLEDLLRDESVERALVFTRTKHGANRLSKQLERVGIGSLAIHGNKTQSARTRALDAFRRGTTRVLIATDVAARGIDVDGVSLVVNFDIPNVAESYVHRIGRTGRAGASGRAISLCDKAERPFLADIERLIRRRLPPEERTCGSRRASAMTEKKTDALRITNQFRSRNGFVYDLRCEGATLILSIKPRENPDDPGDWSVEARVRSQDAAPITAWGPTKRDALREVGVAWVASAPSLGLPTFDWTAVATVLSEVSAV
jgi:superfamily II DNA/RNA helicase